MIVKNNTVFAQADIIANQTNQLETMKKEAVKLMRAYGKAHADAETYRTGMIEYIRRTDDAEEEVINLQREVDRLTAENKRLIDAVSKLFVKNQALEEKVEYYETT